MSNQDHKTVLIVNDSPDQLEIMQLVFQQAGYDILTAADGREGFQIAQGNQLDLIISDVLMPVGDGIELCRLVRADESLRTLPILLVSAMRKEVSNVVEGLEVGADDYIELPVDPLHLVARAERLIERKRMEDLLRESENRFRSVIENVSDVISIVLPDGTILYQSPSLEQVLGYKPEQVIGKNIFDLVHKDDKPEVISFFKNKMQVSVTTPPIEYRFRDSRGVWLNFESVGKFVDDPSKGLVAIINSRNVSERKAAETALRESEERFKAQYKGIPIPTYTWRKTDDDFVLTDFNDAAAKVTNGQIAQFIGVRASELYDASPEIVESFNRCFKEQSLIQHEISYRYKTTGELRELDTRYVFVPPDVVMVHTRDITEQKEAETTLHFQKTLLQAQSEASIDGILIVSPTGEIISCNRRFVEMSGLSEELVATKLRGKILKSAFDQIVDRRGYMKIVSYLNLHPRESYQTEVRLKSGHILDLYTAPVVDTANVHYGRVWFFHDITEQKTAEDKLRQSEEKYRVLIENANDIVYTLNLSGDFTSLNRAGEQITGYTRDEALRMNIADVVGPDDFERVRERIAKNLSGIPQPNFELEIVTKDGNKVLLDISSRLIYQDGAVAGIQGVGRDITERRQAEEAIRFQANLLDTVEQAVIAANLDGIIIYWNRFAHKLYGWSAEEAVGRNIAELTTPEIARKAAEEIMSQLRQGKSWSGEVTVRNKTGSIFPAQILNSPVFDDKGTLLGIVGISIDISERRRIEEEKAELTAQIESQRQRLDTVIANVPGIVWESHFGIDDAQQINFVSDYVETMTGYSVEEWLETPDFWLQIVHPEDKDDVERKAQGFSQKSGSVAQQYRWICKDGQIIWVETQMIILMDTAGKALGIRGVTIDITTRKEAEAAIADANERAIREYDRLLQRLNTLAQTVGTARDLTAIFRAILDFASASVPCAGLFISLYDQENSNRKIIYLWYNGDEEDVSGFESIPVGEGCVGQAIKSGEIVVVNDYLELLKSRGVSLHIGFDEDPREPRSTLVAPMKIKGNSIGAIEVQTYELNAYQAEHITAMGMAANLAATAIENVRLLEQERESAEQLRQSQKLESVGRLAGGIAHDFNNMLTAINGYSELTLRRLKADDPLRENVEEIKKAGERSAALTHQLLAFSRQQVLQSKVLDLNEIISDTITMLQRLIGEDIQLNTILNSNLGRVEADPGQLTQVLMNLVVNARDAMPEGGALTIETTNVDIDEDFAAQHVPIMPGSYVLLAITDTGIGIDNETQQHIFEPFYTTKEIGKGTGLGLATVYGIVKQSGGYIWVDSKIGKGTTFEIYMPRIDEEVKAESAGDASEYMPNGAETILIVEDEDLVRALTRQVLEECGYEIIEARNGVEALSIFEHQDCKIDLLMTDVVMPQMGGRELAEKLAQMHPDLRVLFTSGYTDDAIIRHDVIEADTNFIQKPFTFDALAHKVRESLDNKN